MTAEGREVRRQPQPRVVKVGERLLSTRGWQSTVALDHLRDFHLGQSPLRRECTPACLGRIMWGIASRRAARDARRHLWTLFRFGLTRGVFVILQYNQGPGSHGEVIAFKVYERGSAREDALAEEQLRRMRRRTDCTAEQYTLAERLAHGAEADAEATPA
jgi:hypothetical protein